VIADADTGINLSCIFAPMNPQPDTAFFGKLAQAINDREIIRLTISNKRDKKSDLQSLIVTLAELKRGYRLHFVYRHTTRDITKNFEFEEGSVLIREALEKDFLNADLFTNRENVRLIQTPAGKVKMTTTEPTLQPVTVFSHDRQKERLIEPAGNIYLRELGVTNAGSEVRREMADKFRQINRYIELIEPDIRELHFKGDYRVADMGSGKGYLTFALYDYLTNTLKTHPIMTGIEYRNDLVDTCNTIAGKAGFDRLSFVSGSIESVELDGPDILIALHACDTATDDAIHRGITAGASLIVVAPCCHKQVRREMNVTNELAPLTRFGILKERQAEILTDTIRALILEAYGYKTRVFEFVSTEHTPKNVMITGRYLGRENPDKEKIIRQIDAIRQAYGIGSHYLEDKMRKG
jgi:hypothetical protein